MEKRFVQRAVVLTFVAVMALGCGGATPPAGTPEGSADAGATPSPSGGGLTNAGAQCLDNTGKPRKPGEQWTDGCNTCSCIEAGSVSCTRRGCQ